MDFIAADHILIAVASFTLAAAFTLKGIMFIQRLRNKR